MECTSKKKKKIETENKNTQSQSPFVHHSQKFDNEFSLVLFDQLKTAQEDWLRLIPDNIFFSVPFLEMIEQNPPKGIKPLYAILSQNDTQIAVLSLQLKDIDLSESMNFNEGFKNENAIQRFGSVVRRKAAGIAKFTTLICGNVLLTGEYGFHFADNTILYKDQFGIIEKSLDTIVKLLSKNGYPCGPILMKDYYKDKELSINNVESKFTEFAVQPNMILNIREEWNVFEDYLSSMKSKYRVRAKRAFKKLGEDVVKKEMTIEDIQQNEQKLFDLYMETASEADFNLFTLPVDYFTLLKKQLRDKIKVVAYILEDEIIGYYTILFNTEYMEAHYLGYDKSKNGGRQIYLNMLYDLIKEGINAQVDKIQFARTALEIKSSVGAVPYDMLVYLKHKSNWKNKLVPKLLGFMVPDKEWVPRSPFK